MKRILRSAIALLLVLVFFVGCTANEVENSQAESNQVSEVISEAESIESSEIISEESSIPEAESSLEDKFAGISSFDTKFNAENVIYYDGYMGYPYSILMYFDGLDEVHSASKTFSAYQNASDDDWFVVAFVVNDDVLDVINHIGAIEIPDHPFTRYKDWRAKIDAATNEEEKQALREEMILSYFPGADHKNHGGVIGLLPQYNYVGYFTKPMLLELDKVYFTLNVPYTFMPEIGNNECWFKNLSK